MRRPGDRRLRRNPGEAGCAREVDVAFARREVPPAVPPSFAATRTSVTLSREMFRIQNTSGVQIFSLTVSISPIDAKSKNTSGVQIFSLTFLIITISELYLLSRKTGTASHRKMAKSKNTSGVQIFSLTFLIITISELYLLSHKMAKSKNTSGVQIFSLTVSIITLSELYLLSHKMAKSKNTSGVQIFSLTVSILTISTSAVFSNRWKRKGKSQTEDLNSKPEFVLRLSAPSARMLPRPALHTTTPSRRIAR